MTAPPRLSEGLDRPLILSINFNFQLYLFKFKNVAKDTYRCDGLLMHLSMLSPRGGTPGICGAFDLFCLPHPREFDLESGPQGGDVCFFFARRTGS